MTTKRTLGPLERIFPMPCVLIASGTPEYAGLMTASWINVVSNTPPTIAVGIRSSRETYQHVEATQAFSVNIPTSEMADVADYIGLYTSTKLSQPKPLTTELTLSPGTASLAPIINECPYNLECIVSHVTEVGHYYVVLAEIVETHASEAILVDEESDLVSMDALDPLIYIAGAREYRRLGPKVADAYSVGKRFVDPT